MVEKPSHDIGPKGDGIILSLARSALATRNLRQQFFDADMFGEPAWEIMLLLFISEYEVPAMTHEELVQSSSALPGIAERWVRILKQREVVEVIGDLVRLTPNASSSMRRFLKMNAIGLMAIAGQAG